MSFCTSCCIGVWTSDTHLSACKITVLMTSMNYKHQCISVLNLLHTFHELNQAECVSLFSIADYNGKTSRWSKERSAAWRGDGWGLVLLIAIDYFCTFCNPFGQVPRTWFGSFSSFLIAKILARKVLFTAEEMPTMPVYATFSVWRLLLKLGRDLWFLVSI